jgi:hypothetical protein
MKKQLIGITLAAVLVSMFVFTGGVFAQTELPPEAPADTEPVSDQTLNLYHDERVAALVEMTGLTTEEIEARLAAGETAYDIAMSMDVPQEDFHAVWPMGGAGMRGDGQGDGSALRIRLHTRVQDGTCLAGCDPQNLNTTCEPINLQDGTGAGRRGRNSK